MMPDLPNVVEIIGTALYALVGADPLNRCRFGHVHRAKVKLAGRGQRRIPVRPMPQQPAPLLFVHLQLDRRPPHALTLDLHRLPKPNALPQFRPLSTAQRKFGLPSRWCNAADHSDP
jgi:hypothetical protein